MYVSYLIGTQTTCTWESGRREGRWRSPSYGGGESSFSFSLLWPSLSISLATLVAACMVQRSKPLALVVNEVKRGFFCAVWTTWIGSKKIITRYYPHRLSSNVLSAIAYFSNIVSSGCNDMMETGCSTGVLSTTNQNLFRQFHQHSMAVKQYLE